MVLRHGGWSNGVHEHGAMEKGKQGKGLGIEVNMAYIDDKQIPAKIINVNK